MTSKNLIEQWKKDESTSFEGWDFSYIKNRTVEEDPPWNYQKLAKDLLDRSTAVLDMATGGGEVFSSLSPFPKHAVAIEGYPPNVPIARKRLEPLGITVLEANETGALPFSDGEFDLVLNRHGGLQFQEIYRVLKKSGHFLTQQVGGDNLLDLMAIFNVKPEWPGNVLEVVRKKMVHCGFKLLEAEEWKGKISFKDIGALVYFLKAIPWIVDHFTVDSHLAYLEKMQKNLEQESELKFTNTRFLLLASKE